MTGFGEKMRREREMRGVSLEEISGSTKIGTRSLKALEEEDFEKLPGGIFNKGFVRAYARFLGLDEEQAVTDFEAAWRDYEADKRPVLDIQAESQEAEAEASSNRLLMIALIVLLAVVAAGAVKFFWGKRAESTSQASTPQSQETSPPPASNGGNSVATPSNPISEPAEASKTNSGLAESTGGNNSTEPSAKIVPSPVPTPKAAATDLSSNPSPASSNSAIRLEVTAHEDSWLSVSADGKSLGQGILSAQKSRTIRANKEVRLRVGNVAGVEVSFNGKQVNVDGEPKQVKELIFTPDGLQQ